MESFEQQGQLIRWNGCAQIPHGDIGFAVLFGDLDRDGRPLGGELCRVIQQVVAHLSHRVRIAPDHHRVLRELGVHVQTAVVDPPLQADQHPGHDLDNIELFLGGDRLCQGIEPGQVQHPPHQAGETPGLGHHHVQSVPLLLRRNRPVQNALCKAGDGGHGGLQFVGDVGNKLRPLALHLGQGVGHGVEGLGQLPDLIAPVLVVVHPYVELAPPKFPGGLRHLGEGAGLMGGGNGTGDDGNEQDHHRGEEENGSRGAPHLRQSAGIA